MTDDPDLALAGEFPPATRDQWLKLVDGVLKGAPFEKLSTRTYDNLAIAPLYGRAERARPTAGRAVIAPWRVMQRIDHPDPAAANRQALEDLENGATGLTLVFAASLNANGFGLPGSPEALERVLDGVHLDAGVTIDLNLSPQSRNVVRHFAALVKRRDIAPDSVDLCASINPLGGMAAAGQSPVPWRTLAANLAILAAELAGEGFRGPFVVADGRIVHNAGGSEAQELAFALSSALAYLRALEGGGHALAAARRMIYFRLAADADQFLTLAKFRAARRLWARVEEACGLAPEPVFVAAETAWRMMTRRDPWVNVLRTTMAVFAAGLGGADSIAVFPFSAALGLPDAFARRLARNTQLILLEESSLAKVADPAAGSGGIEDITDGLCEAAWALFQEIEATGGTAAALEAGLIQDKVAAVRREREAAVARRRDPLTGTSEFPDLRELPVAVLDVPAAQEPAATVTFAALPRIRLAEPFERLREASDAHLQETGARPRVFLANLGKLSEFTARAAFARNLFEAGGIEAVTNEGFADVAEMVAAFRASGAKLACLCSSDEVYGNRAVATAAALKAAGASHLYLAGRPKDQDAFLAAGIATFIYAGCDAVAVLRMAHEQVAQPI